MPLLFIIIYSLATHTDMLLRYLPSNLYFSKYALYNFATKRTLRKIASSLYQMDSLELDAKCEAVLKDYNYNGKQTRKILAERTAKIMDKNYNPLEKPEEAIVYLYETLTAAKVGFLKGDINAYLVFHLNKKLQNLNSKDLNHEFNNQQIKKFLKEVTNPKKFRLPQNGIPDSSKQDKNNIYQRQLLLEMVSEEQSKQKFDTFLQSMKKMGKVHLSQNLRKYSVEWFMPLCQAIRDEQLKCKNPKESEKGTRKVYAEFFVKLQPEKIASVCISELMRQITQVLYKDQEIKNSMGVEKSQQKYKFEQYNSIQYRSLCLSLCKHIKGQLIFEGRQRNFKAAMKLYDDFNQKKKQQASQSSPGEYPEGIEPISHLQDSQEAKEFAANIQSIYKTKYVKPQDRKQYLSEMSKTMIRNLYKYKQEDAMKTSENVQYQMGSVLIFLMKEIIRCRNKQGYRVPLLSLEHKYVRRGKKVTTQKCLKINEFFLDTIIPEIQKEKDLTMHLERAVPTIIQPMPWIEYQIGGYYLHPSTIMRFSNCQIQQRLVKYADLRRVYRVLNFLGSIPWRINKNVLRVVESIWDEGGDVGALPKRYSKQIITFLSKINKEKFDKQKAALAKIIQSLRDDHSERSMLNLKLNLARSYQNLDRFFFPHNLDFRGRVYPIPPHMNHIGDDLSRGLLLFADGKKLGENGLKWLKIHCANLMGKDKATLMEKLQFVDENIGLIKSIAEDPLKERVWLTYQDCWQALGAIFELNEALKHPNPQQFVSHLHVHQDGSCNGLQHYAALGRDMQGAYQVNLGPTERPGDVYTHVAKMVIKTVEKDIANPESTNHEIAKKVQGNIKRKTIKQTVMTSVYGVTFIGARDQIQRQLKDQDFLKEQDQVYAASIYLAKCTLQAISNLFNKAHLIKRWLITCADLVASTNNPIGWVTPMGLPVMQPYRKQSSTDMVNTIIQDLRLALRSQNVPVDKGKQKSAFPPNFVHSLDSTHMMYTAERCMQNGIAFAAVHDSYWTHAGSLEKMNSLLRDEFIRLHSQPLLENLKSSLEKRYPQIKFPPIPDRGEFNLQLIKQSPYFFS